MSAKTARVAMVAGLALLGLSLTSAPAPAQFMQLFGFPSVEPPPPLPPEAIAARLARAGYKLTRLRRGPQGYVADTIDPSGRPMRLVLDPIDGALLQRSALTPAPEPGVGSGASSPGSGAREPSRRPAERRGTQSSAQSEGAETGSRHSSGPGEPSPVNAPPPKPAAPYVPKTGPGYSHGVPINPLD